MFTKKRAQGKVSLKESTHDRRLLVVNVIEARGIVAAHRGISNPYLVCSLIDLSEREVRSEKYVTQPVKGSLNPTFGQTFSFGKHKYIHDI